jgi:hypothetical protein
LELSLLSQTDVFIMRPQTLFEDHGTYAVQRTPAGLSYYPNHRRLPGEPRLPTLAE